MFTYVSHPSNKNSLSYSLKIGKKYMHKKYIDGQEIYCNGFPGKTV